MKEFIWFVVLVGESITAWQWVVRAGSRLTPSFINTKKN